MLIRKYIVCIIIGLIFPFILFSQERNSILCSDGMDNDGDGKIDCLDEECATLPNGGCSICNDGKSFADTLLAYIPGQCSFLDPDPSGALGVSDWTGISLDEPQIVFLGQGGAIKLGFTNNLLTNSGDSSQDLWIFEVGYEVESSLLALRPADIYTKEQLALNGILDTNSDEFFEVGSIGGSTSGLDLDEIMPGYSPGVLQFDAVEIKDVVDGGCMGETPGADIDAVCALSSLNYDCRGELNGIAVFDACGECLSSDDPAFNQSCTDCLGIPYGEAMLDNCGECLRFDDPAFNQNCLPDFELYIPNTFSPNMDGINDKFQIFKMEEYNARISSYFIFNMWEA